MAFSAHTYVGDGTDAQLTVNFTLGFLSRDDVHAYVEGEGTERTITWINDGLITIGSVDIGLEILIRRETNKTVLAHDYSNGAVITEDHLDRSNLQNIMLVHEVIDGFRDEEFEYRSDQDLGGFRIINLGEPIDGTDAATKNFADGVLTSVAADVALVEAAVDDAEAQVVLAADQVALAQAEVTNAAAQVTLASGHADDAETAQTAAELAQTNAETAQTGAELAETNAQAHELKAEKWAEEDEDVEVEPGKYSSLHHAAKAATTLSAAFIDVGQITNLDTVIGSVHFGFDQDAIGAPDGTYDAVGWQIVASGQTTQWILRYEGASNSFLIRTDDGSGFSDWNNVVLDTGTITSLIFSDEVRFEGAAGNSALIQKNATALRDELQIYAGGDAYSTGSRGAGIHLYGNSDSQHSGNCAILTGPNDNGDAHLIVAEDGKVTIGNDLWDYVDNGDTVGELNIKQGSGAGIPCLYLDGASSTEGEIAWPSGETLSMGVHDGATFTKRFEVNGNGLHSIWSNYTVSTNDVLHMRSDVGGTGVLNFYVEADGDCFNTNNSYGGISDRRVKENIVEATPKLDELRQIEVVNYNLIEDESKTKFIGVIAQQIETIFPGLVTTKENEEGVERKAVKYSVLTPMLLKGLQELSDKVDAQDKLIADLSKRLEALES